MTSRTITLTEVYTKLNNTSEYIVQALGTCEVVLSDTQPVETEQGFMLEKGDAVNKNTFGESTLWGKARVPTAVIVAE